MTSFASDNYAGVHPKILDALVRASTGHIKSYGGDSEYTARAEAQFKRHFGPACEVFFVFNGTAANVLSLASITQSFNAILCSEYAHIHMDECGAPEKFTGCKLITLPSKDGKITPAGLQAAIKRVGDQHFVQMKAVSISQTTEYGTVYQPQEVAAIAECAHRNNLLLHMDGARISNAAASLGCSFREFTTDAGVDVLSFGGTKIGMMLGEAVVFLQPELSRDFLYRRKQSMQLASKMRFLSVQFETLLEADLWKESATHANQMAKLLKERLNGIPGVKITQPVQANAVFAQIPREIVTALQSQFAFYLWDEATCEARWMTAFDTRAEDIERFAEEVRNLVKAISA